MTPAKKQKIGKLADALLARHLQESWPEPKDSIPTWFDGGIPPRYDDSLRTVAVVGSGASVPMMSIADDLATELEEELEGDSRDREVELDRLENVYGLKRKNFETRLTALCRTPEAERKVKQRIGERYQYQHPSLLSYELLAHLLHHRFLDAIISFNFDELLDQAIDDELGPNEYIRVVTERDCDPEVPASAPLYIKMHGTASEPDSLRFTRERYYWTPRSIVELVEKQFDVEHLVMVNVGFSLASFDFQYLLRKPDQLQIFHFDPRRMRPSVLREVRKQRSKCRLHQKLPRPDIYDKPNVVDFSSGARKPGPDFLPELLDDLVEVLQERCEAHGSVPVCWRSTLRHRAVVEALKGSPIGTKSQYASYLRRRAILEFAFAAARGRGVLSIASMVDDRCGRYYDLYRRKAGNNADSWLKLCSAGGLQESQKHPDTFEVISNLRQTPGRGGHGSIHQLRLADAPKLAAHTVSSLNVPPQRLKEIQKLLTETIRFLQEETEIEVHSRDDRICSKTFAKPVILKTFTALRGWTRQMLEGTPDYNELWAISETGDWLAHEGTGMLNKFHERAKKADPPSHGGKPVRLLTAFESDLGKYTKTTDVRRLPWGRHNRHMTVLCKDAQPRAAIYFVRRLRAPTVTPVYLSNQKDLRRVAQSFATLWHEAGVYEKSL
jgi:SIR2-like domain